MTGWKVSESNENITFALPSKGAIAQPTIDFLRDSGLRVNKPNPRQYTGDIPRLDNVTLLFQRVKDVVYKVADGTAQIGITGYDVVCEHPHQDLVILHDSLGYGHCQLVVAVPETWGDVTSMMDLADIALDFREEKRRNLRVATTYTHLTRQFFHASGIHHFALARAEGAIEAAPTMGYADIIVDLTQTGTTLRENHLKTLPDGTILNSQACLVANLPALMHSKPLRHTLRQMLELIDASMAARSYMQITVNVYGDTPETIASEVMSHPTTRGLLGPTIAPIYGTEGSRACYTVTLMLEQRDLQPAVDHLRRIGATQVIATSVKYVFLAESPSYRRIQDQFNLPD